MADDMSRFRLRDVREDRSLFDYIERPWFDLIGRRLLRAMQQAEAMDVERKAADEFNRQDEADG